MFTGWMYVAYLLTSLVVTVWVAHTLHKNGRIFLVDAFHGNEPLADSVNHLLVVGFYLINVGYVTLALKYGVKPQSWVPAIESFSTKIGLVLLVLGVMHFFNLAVLSVARKRGIGAGRPDPSAPRPATPTEGRASGPFVDTRWQAPSPSLATARVGGAAPNAVQDDPPGASGRAA